MYKIKLYMEVNSQVQMIEANSTHRLKQGQEGVVLAMSGDVATVKFKNIDITGGAKIIDVQASLLKESGSVAKTKTTVEVIETPALEEVAETPAPTPVVAEEAETEVVTPEEVETPEAKPEVEAPAAEEAPAPKAPKRK